MNLRSEFSSVRCMCLWTILVVTTLCLPNTLWAQTSGGSLDDVLLNLGPATEADVRIIAAGQANDPAGPKYPSVAVEQRTFTGLFRPYATSTQLAIFSDDGCDIYVDGTKIHSRLNVGQALPNLGASFHLVTPSQPWEAGRSYLIRIDYSNTIYQGLTDIDGATLFAFNGGGEGVYATVDRVIVDGSSPEDLGPELLCVGSDITLRAMPSPSTATFATGTPVWSLDEKPPSSTLVVNGTGVTQAFTPDVEGVYVLRATSDSGYDTFEVFVPRLTSLTITENGIDSTGFAFDRGNEITVTDISNEVLYICDHNGPLSAPNHISLSVTVEPDLPPELMSRVVYKVDGTGASPSAGNFGTSPEISLFSRGIYYTVSAGIDCNNNSALDGTERTHSGRVTTIDFSTAQIKGNRTSAPEESLFPVKDTEHFEVGGTFHFELTGNSVGPNSLIRYIVEDTDGITETLASGTGVSFDHTWSYDDRGDVRIRFYGDSNENSEFNWFSEYDISREIWVQKLYEHNLDVNVSTRVDDLVYLAYSQEMMEIALFVNIPKVQTCFDMNSLRALKKDSDDDWRSCIKLIANPNNYSTFVPGPGQPDPATSPFDMHAHVSDNNWDVTILENMNARGATTPRSDEMVIWWDGCQNNPTVVHELIHIWMESQDHVDDPTRIICRGDLVNPEDEPFQNKLSAAEAEAID
jgi:hypothetical protein